MFFAMSARKGKLYSGIPMEETEQGPQQPPAPKEDTILSPSSLWGKFVNAAALVLVGFLISQLTVVAEVKKNSQEIAHLKENLDQSKTDFNERMRNMTNLVAEQTRLTTELVTLIKVQNQIQASKP